MRAESAPVRVLGKCPAFEAVVMAARVVVMRSPIPNLRNNDKCNYRLLFRGYQRELPPRPLRACPMGHPADQIPPSLGAPAVRSHCVRIDGGMGGSKVKSRTRPRPCAKFPAASKIFSALRLRGWRQRLRAAETAAPPESTASIPGALENQESSGLGSPAAPTRSECPEMRPSTPAPAARRAMMRRSRRGGGPLCSYFD